MWGRKQKVMLSAGQAAPSFQLAQLNGGQKSLQEILEKGPALLVFYKISCPVCQLTAPYLERLAGGQKLQVIGISQDDASATQSFNQRFAVTYPTLLDEQQKGYAASNAFGISSVPALFLVEQDGNIAAAFNGFSKHDIAALGERAGQPAFRPEDNVPEWKAG